MKSRSLINTLRAYSTYLPFAVGAAPPGLRHASLCAVCVMCGVCVMCEHVWGVRACVGCVSICMSGQGRTGEDVCVEGILVRVCVYVLSEFGLCLVER
jgi:hypothetical protein